MSFSARVNTGEFAFSLSIELGTNIRRPLVSHFGAYDGGKILDGRTVADR